MRILIYYLISLIVFYSNSHCMEIEKDNILPKIIVKQTKKEIQLSEDDLKKLIENAYMPNKKNIKSVNQDKDIIFYEKQKSGS